MNLVLEALRLRWPAGIPAQDYERMLSVVHIFGDTATPPPSPPPVVKGKSRGKVGAPTIERVRQLLSTGPATAREISVAAGVDLASVYAVLRQLGAVASGKAKRGGSGGSGLYPNLWRLPAK